MPRNSAADLIRLLCFFVPEKAVVLFDMLILYADLTIQKLAALTPCTSGKQHGGAAFKMCKKMLQKYGSCDILFVLKMFEYLTDKNRRKEIQDTEVDNVMGERFTVGLVVASLSDQFSKNIARGAMTAAEELDLNLAIIPMKYIGRENAPESADEKYEYMFNTLLTHVSSSALDFIIISTGEIAYSMTKQDMQAFLKGIGETPVLSIAAEVEGFESLVFDNASGVSEAVEYLIKAGRKRIGLMKGEPYNYDCIERNDAYKKTLEANGIEYDEKLTVFNDMSSFCHDQVEKLLSDNPDIDAIICCNDATATTVYEVLERHNITVGEQIAVVGFDDLPIAQQLSPALSSVRADAEQLAYMAVNRAKDYLDGSTQFIKHERVPTKFILRESCIRKTEKPDNSWIFELSNEECAENLVKIAYTELVPSEQWESAKKACMQVLAKVDEVLRVPNATEQQVQEFIDLIDRIFRRRESFFEYNISRFLGIVDVGMKWLLEHHRENIKNIITVFTHLYQMIAYSCEMHRTFEGSRSAELSHRSNIITRDVLMFATEDINGAFGSMLRQLHLLNITTGYMYLLEKPAIYNSRFDVQRDMSWQLEAYHIGERVFTVPEGRKTVSAQQLFTNSYMPHDRRWTMVMTVLYSANMQYGLAVFEMGFEQFGYLEYLTYQLSAAVKIQELIRTQNETLIQLNKINITLHNMSSLDQLTGTLNRRGFYSEAAKQFEQISDKLIVVFVDLDGLKMINDNFGHSEGDIAIKAVADCLREVIADIGIVGRVGGDEFVAMMPSIFDNMSEYVRNKCNEVLDQLNERLKRPYKIAMSMGIFECKADEYKNISEIIDKADYLLYVQKRERKKLLDS